MAILFANFERAIIDTVEHDQAAPGQPPGFLQLSGWRFNIESNYETPIPIVRHLENSNGYEIMILLYTLETPFPIPNPFSKGWWKNITTIDSGNTFFIGGLHKNGPPNPSLPWNNSIAKPYKHDVISDGHEVLTIEFECPGGNYHIVVDVTSKK
ncbi:MAG TPA: hypothetical protein VGO50_08860 [Pyrinomonadaceae bacterium]|jgi:hypothetical protein|nr:hypothetical protein [Pyrinomonadaceae bacterium]